MTKERFDSLPDGTLVWFHPHYFAFPMLGTIRTYTRTDGVWGEFSGGGRGIWVNFYGEGQCLFTPPEYKSDWYECVSLHD